jgi:hypothetical protein
VRLIAGSGQRHPATAAVVCLLLVVLLDACGAKALPLPIRGVPWGDGEVSTYVWLEGATQVGTAEMAQARANGWWVIRNSIALGGFSQQAEVVVDASILSPSQSHLVVKGQPADYSIDAAYDLAAKQVKLAAHTVQGDQQFSVKLPAGHFVDNEQFLTTLRAVPLADGFKTDVNLVNTSAGQSITISVAVSGRETITLAVDGLPAAEQRVYRVSLLGGAQTAWIGVDAPYLLLKYDNGQRQMVMTGYVAGIR